MISDTPRPKERVLRAAGQGTSRGKTLESNRRTGTVNPFDHRRPKNTRLKGHIGSQADLLEFFTPVGRVWVFSPAAQGYIMSH